MPFPMGKGHLLPWGIRGHPLTRSWHFVYTKCVSCKSLAAFLSQKWNNVREMERGNVPEMEQRSRNGTGNCPGNGTMFEKWNRELSRKWNDVRKMEQEIHEKYNAWKGGEDVIDKHFRLTEEAVRRIEGRDRIRYPTESRFIIDAVIAFSEKEERKEEERELRKLCEKLDTFLQWFEEHSFWKGKGEPPKEASDPYDYLDGI